uniref:Protein YIF1B n=1 Tax=Aegilops tauschii TaxID=37682 RepID=N1R4W6_AEGTA
MYDNYRNPHPPGMQIPPPNPQPGPYDNPLYGASSGLIKTGLGVYGEKFLGSSSEFMQSNISRYFSNPQYYFHVNDQYVRNKLKVILFPFLHRGHWTRISEPVGGRLSYKPPMYDINAPDLYIPFMAFGSFIILAGFTLGFMGNGVSVRWAIPGYRRPAPMVLLVLGDDAVDEHVHGDLPGEDDEAGDLHRDAGQREALDASALLPALHGHRAVPPLLLAR